MSYVLHRNLRKNPPRAIRGDGAYLIDHSGKRYLDASGGAAVSCLGHSHPAIIEAIQTQVAKLPYAHTSFFTTDVLEDLAETLVKGAPGMRKVLLLSGGSETIEAALKLSRQYFLEAGEPPRDLPLLSATWDQARLDEVAAQARAWLRDALGDAVEWRSS